ncbi:ABC transporter ATP-binding protein [Pseudomonas orientalis]|uniref:ABC transporter ATP-binding protein n=1 Tax=Pseudomonas orientalis TaxID=76758 RepID=UPI0034D64E5B
MIEVNNLTKYLGKKSVISDFSFCAQRHECVGLLGEHGAGKTTLLNLISGMARPTSGHVSIQGLSTQTHSTLARQAVGYQLQGGITHHTLSVKSILNFVAAARGFRGAEKRRHVDRVAMRLELHPVLNCPIDVLSLDLKRRVAIAQAILHSPGVLLLDEPTEGLNTEQQLKFRALAQSLAEEMSIIIASRHYDALSEICTRALVIAGGRLVADSSLADLQRCSRHFQAVTLAADPPVDLLALAVLPGVAGIEEDRQNPGKVTVLAMPGHAIFPAINSLITHRGWNITSLHLEPGRLNDVVHHLSHEVSS